MESGWYERHLLPYVIDIACGLKPVRQQREKIVPLAEGQVLEVGIGTGLNVAHYDKAKVRKIVGLDPAMEMHRLAEAHEETGRPSSSSDSRPSASLSKTADSTRCS